MRVIYAPAVGLAFALACADDPNGPRSDRAPAGVDTADSGDPIVDADGDGFLSDEDCDDQDPDVTPLTEIWVPAGPFTRGDDQQSPDQSPMREITLSAYCLDVLEVSNAQFVTYLDAQAAAGLPNQDDDGRDLYDFEDDDDEVPARIVDQGDGTYASTDGYADHPVVEVYHWAAAAYCASRGQALPTEAQWEKAARGTESPAFPWGDAAPDCTLGNLRPGPEGVSPDGETVEPCVGDTVATGSYPSAPGPYGHLDLAGNAAEFVHDWYRDDYYASSDDTDPMGPETGWSDNLPGGGAEARLTRGGSFATGDFALTPSFRYVEPADATSNGVGFRCARALD
jgi:formylglycine-generating enzyme required for sulfatase activity